MRTFKFVPILLVATSISVGAASMAHAQARTEIGASLISGTVGLGDDEVSTIGIPSGGFGVLSPGVYASFFLGDFVAVEPQIGLIWASFGGDSAYILNFVGQVDYFLTGTDGASPYVFGAAGLLSQTGEDYTPKSFGLGVGYRIPVDDRLAFRLDGRYTHFTSEFDGGGGDTLTFAFSIGGVFGR